MFKVHFSRTFRYAVLVPALLICSLLATGLPTYASNLDPHTWILLPMASCSGAGCYTKDPYATNCANSYSVVYNQALDANNNVLATVWNYYSISCNANWAQAALSSLAMSYQYSLVVLIKTPTTGFPSEQQCYPDNCAPGYTGPYQAWTNMIDGTSLTRATVRVFDKYGRLVSTAYVDQ